MRATINLKRPIIKIEANFDENSIEANGYEILRWIPCSECMPEKYVGQSEKYINQWLCCTSNGDIMILPYGTPPGGGIKGCAFYKLDDDGYFYRIFDVVAWMPLPKPYEEEN